MVTVTKRHVAAGAGIVTLLVAFVAPFEGLRTKAYRDPADIWTICYGETQGVTPGQIKSPQECADMLAQRLPDYLGPVDRLMPGLPDNRRIAYTDFAYNTGVATLSLRRKGTDGQPVPGTSVVDLERAGRWRQACERIALFVYAKGKKLPGLVKRREAEKALCLNG